MLILLKLSPKSGIYNNQTIIIIALERAKMRKFDILIIVEHYSVDK